MRDLSSRFSVALALTLLADLLLFRHPLGIGLTLLAACFAVVAAVRFGRRLHHARFWCLVWLVPAVAATFEPSVTGVLILIGLGWAIAAMCQLGPDRSLFQAVVRGLAGGARSFTAAPDDARRTVLIAGRRAGRSVGPVWVYAVPAVVTAVFAMLIVPANLMLSRWVTSFTVTMREAIIDFDGSRAMFWIVVFLGSYGLLRFKLGRHPGHKRRFEGPPQDEAHRAQELKACVLTLVATNVLFLAANVTDLAYLWMRFELPEGLTYSQYAHRGTYRLVVAVVLAALTIVFFFRSGTRQAEHRPARLLAAAFVVQNLFVLAGAASRLGLYAEAYGLTRLRVATVFWLALVGIGFVLLGLRILQRRSLRFLLDANTAATLLVLTCWSAIDIDGYVADWNVDRHLRDPEATMDVSYLGDLGPGALPALARLAREGRPGVADRAKTTLIRGVRAERARHEHWAAWSYRRHVALRDAEPAVAD